MAEYAVIVDINQLLYDFGIVAYPDGNFEFHVMLQMNRVSWLFLGRFRALDDREGRRFARKLHDRFPDVLWEVKLCEDEGEAAEGGTGAGVAAQEGSTAGAGAGPTSSSMDTGTQTGGELDAGARSDASIETENQTGDELEAGASRDTKLLEMD